jgi:uncharacterized protein
MQTEQILPIVSSTRHLMEIQTVLLKLQPILRDRYRVTSLGIFGSYARNEQRSDSDVDILIDYIQPPSLVRVVELRDFLIDRLGIAVDVVTKNGLRSAIRDEVLSDVIYLWNAEE